MQFLLLAVSMLACLVGGITTKVFTNRYSGSALQHFYNAVVSLISGVALLVLGGIPSASIFTVLLGLLFGLVTALQKITSLKALSTGPYAYTTVISCLSTLIPALSGAIFWQEKIAAVQIVGMVLMFACFFLSVDFSGEQKKASLKWFLYALAAFFCTGFIGVMQKWHQNTPFKAELDAFLIIAFAFSFCYSAVFCLLQALKAKDTAILKPVLKFSPILLLVAAGICAAANNKLNLFLSGQIDSAVFYPVVNGGHLVLTTLVAVIFFRERLTKRQWLGLILGIASVLLLCNPFG